MAVSTIDTFRTNPGRMADHTALTVEAVHRLREMGQAALGVRALAGSEVGTLTVSVNFADNAAHAAFLDRAQRDPEWQQFYARAMSSQAAEHVESSVFSDLDPTWQADPSRPTAVISATQWAPIPGQMGKFMEHLQSAVPHIERLGGSVRTAQSIIGLHPMTVLVTEGFADLAAYGAYGDKIAVDEQWQAFWAEVMAQPSAHLVRSGLFVSLDD